MKVCAGRKTAYLNGLSYEECKSLAEDITQKLKPLILDKGKMTWSELIEKTDPTGFTSDTHLVVERVIVVSNEHVESDEHISGENWCSTFFGGGTWKQTSYNHNFRKMYAGKGFTFDSAKDKFIQPQPYASWVLDGNDDWQAPVTYPTDTTEKNIHWDEEGQKWVASAYGDAPETVKFNWDASALAWVSV